MHHNIAIVSSAVFDQDICRVPDGLPDGGFPYVGGIAMNHGESQGEEVGSRLQEVVVTGGSPNLAEGDGVIALVGNFTH
jgi:hypothetical protein